jgi:hypothetical protein
MFKNLRIFFFEKIVKKLLKVETREIKSTMRDYTLLPTF